MKKVSGTKEWSDHSANFMKGCEHLCKYCYGNEFASRFNRIENPEDWGKPEFVQHLFDKEYGKRNGIIMFPTTHDIHPDNLSNSIIFLEKLLKPGNQVLIVSKPHPKCIEKICDSLTDYKDQILFRFTIGSADNNVLKFWEPGAPTFEERNYSLYYAKYKRFKTSVSCEPMLDNNIDDVISMVESSVTDSIWLGKMNNLGRCKTNGPDDELSREKLNQIRKWQSDENIIKLYNQFKDHPKIKWKESIKKVVGLDIPTEKGLDI